MFGGNGLCFRMDGAELFEEKREGIGPFPLADIQMLGRVRDRRPPGTVNQAQVSSSVFCKNVKKHICSTPSRTPRSENNL